MNRVVSMVELKRPLIRTAIWFLEQSMKNVKNGTTPAIIRTPHTDPTPRGSFLGLGLGCAQNASKDGAGLHTVRGQGGPFMRFRGGEFSTGTMRNFQPELTQNSFLMQKPNKRALRRVVSPGVNTADSSSANRSVGEYTASKWVC